MKITSNIEKEFIKPSIDLAVDYGEIGLDEFVGGHLAKELPIVKTLIAFVKTGVMVRERFFIKKFCVFLQEFHKNTLQNQELEKFKVQFETDKNYREKVLEQILVLIEKFDSIKKSKILAHLFIAHINGCFDWKRFVSMSGCLNNLSEYCYPYLQRIASFSKIYEDGRRSWLLDIGMNPKIFENTQVSIEISSLLISAGICHTSGTARSITKLGQDLYIYGISKVE